jgi:MinD superfamily P-loop ATPase
MKQIVVVSGKGGTGKTILTASLAVLADNCVIADCDVDAADLHLLLHPEFREHHEFRSGQTASIEQEICQHCGHCIDVCRFDAIEENFIVDPISCEGCGVCARICPEHAVRMEKNITGVWFVSSTRYGPFVHARLGVAEENSGKLVTEVKQAAIRIAKEQNRDYLIIDGPPGIGCPVIASLAGADFALIVTEPTLSGIHDLKRVIELASFFRIDAQVIINKWDLNSVNSNKIEKICLDRDIEIIGRIRFSREVYESLVNLQPIVEYNQGGIADEIRSIWKKLERSLCMGDTRTLVRSPGKNRSYTGSSEAELPESGKVY